MMECKVSIIIPVYNAEGYLKKCIDSIRNQSLSEIEIILINDGSTDRSKDICDYYKDLDKRIKVIHTKNKGVSHARNIGIQNASGKCIMFADSDDYVEKGWCQKLYNLIISESVDLVICGYNVENQRGKKIYIETRVLSEKENVSSLIVNDFFVLYLKNLLNSPCNKIFRLDIIKKYCIKYDETLSLGEDMIFNLEYINLMSNEKIIVLNKGLYNYVWEEKQSLDYKYYDNLYDIYKHIYHILYETLEKRCDDLAKYEEFYWKRYFFMLERVLENTFNKKNKDNLILKLKRNNSILKDEDFQKSLSYITKNDVKNLYLIALRSKNYVFVYLSKKLIQFLYRIKQRILE